MAKQLRNVRGKRLFDDKAHAQLVNKAIAADVAASQWRPIETAPKDRRILISWKPGSPGEKHDVFVARWGVAHWVDDRDEIFDNDPFWAPTHWMELQDEAHKPPG